jgi:hypothetical protein
MMNCSHEDQPKVSCSLHRGALTGNFHSVVSWLGLLPRTDTDISSLPASQLDGWRLAMVVTDGTPVRK